MPTGLLLRLRHHSETNADGLGCAPSMETTWPACRVALFWLATARVVEGLRPWIAKWVPRHARKPDRSRRVKHTRKQRGGHFWLLKRAFYLQIVAIHASALPDGRKLAIPASSFVDELREFRANKKGVPSYPTLSLFNCGTRGDSITVEDSTGNVVTTAFVATGRAAEVFLRNCQGDEYVRIRSSQPRGRSQWVYVKANAVNFVMVP